jgi:hypothetical protein
MSHKRIIGLGLSPRDLTARLKNLFSNKRVNFIAAAGAEELINKGLPSASMPINDQVIDMQVEFAQQNDGPAARYDLYTLPLNANVPGGLAVIATFIQRNDEVIERLELGEQSQRLLAFESLTIDEAKQTLKQLIADDHVRFMAIGSYLDFPTTATALYGLKKEATDAKAAPPEEVVDYLVDRWADEFDYAKGKFDIFIGEVQMNVDIEGKVIQEIGHAAYIIYNDSKKS